MKDGTYYITSSGDLCNIELVDNNCPIDNTLKVEGSGERPNGGAVTISEESVLSSVIKFDDQKVIKSLGEKFILKDEEDNEICTLISGPEKKVGSKYACEVKPGILYNFYVLSYNDENNNVILDKSKAVTTNLIMDSNINSFGEAIKNTYIAEKDNGLVLWVSKEDYNDNSNYGANGKTDKGPITVMNYLEGVTSSWTNLTKMTISEFDSYDSSGTLLKTDSMQTYNVYARMPYLSELSKVGCGYLGYMECPLWLVEYLNDAEEETGKEYQQNPVDGIGGYWTLSSSGKYYQSAWFVDSSGGSWFWYPSLTTLGVRPVITVEL